MRAAVGRTGLLRHALSVSENKEDAEAGLVALRALDVRRDDQPIGILAVQHDEFLKSMTQPSPLFFAEVVTSKKS